MTKYTRKPTVHQNDDFFFNLGLINFNFKGKFFKKKTFNLIVQKWHDYLDENDTRVSQCFHEMKKKTLLFTLSQNIPFSET
jgi:hypothetical protein